MISSVGEFVITGQCFKDLKTVLDQPAGKVASNH